MPNSTSSDSFQLIKEDQNEIINPENSSPPISNSSDGYQETVSNQNLDQIKKNHQEQRGGSSDNNTTNLDDEQEKKIIADIINEEITATMRLGQSEVADDDEGFRTPTSLDQRIPVIPKKCPPAPRKSRPPSPQPCSRKRKFSRRKNIVSLDFSSEVESFFPPIIREDLGKKMKKSPKGDEDDANK